MLEGTCSAGAWSSSGSIWFSFRIVFNVIVVWCGDYFDPVNSIGLGKVQHRTTLGMGDCIYPHKRRRQSHGLIGGTDLRYHRTVLSSSMLLQSWRVAYPAKVFLVSVDGVEHLFFICGQCCRFYAPPKMLRHAILKHQPFLPAMLPALVRTRETEAK